MQVSNTSAKRRLALLRSDQSLHSTETSPWQHFLILLEILVIHNAQLPLYLKLIKSYWYLVTPVCRHGALKLYVLHAAAGPVKPCVYN